MKRKLLLSSWALLLVFGVNSSYGQWTVYDGSVLPENATPAWSKVDHTDGVSSIVDDPDITGNKLLMIEDLSENSKDQYALDWQLADPNTGVTILIRTKPTQGIIDYAPTSARDDRFLFLSPRNGAFQEALIFYYPDRMLLNQSNKSATFPEPGWTVYRLTMKADSVYLYVNEQTYPLLAAKTPKTTTDNTLKFGDSNNDPYGGYIDWVIWDISGAYAPGEGTELPGTLTGLEMLDNYFMVIFNVTDGTDPLEGATVTFGGLDKTTDAEGKAVFLNITPASGMEYTVTLVGYDDATGTLDVVDADVNQDVVLTETDVTYTVTFNVTDGTNPLIGASVTLNDNTVSTNASGEAVFEEVSPGTGLAYTVTLSGYNNYSGTLDVVDADVSMDVTLTVAGGDNWTVYDGSELLENALLGWTKDRTTAGVTDGTSSVLYSVVDDPDISGNKLLKCEDLSVGTRESWQLEWQVMNPETGLTIVMRVKPTEDILEYAPTVETSFTKFFYISPRNGAFKDAVAFYYPDSLIFNNAGEYLKYTQAGWSIFRMTLKGNAMDLYINENPVPVLSNADLVTANDNRLLFGNNTNEPYGSYVDWMIWDLTGAFAPGEGSQIPGILSLDYDVENAIGTQIVKAEPLRIYPNPASANTKIIYVVETTTATSLGIFDITGKQITSLVNEVRQPGTYEIDLDTGGLPSGMYFCRFRSGDKIIIGKLMKN